MCIKEEPSDAGRKYTDETVARSVWQMVNPTLPVRRAKKIESTTGYPARRENYFPAVRVQMYQLFFIVLSPRFSKLLMAVLWRRDSVNS